MNALSGSLILGRRAVREALRTPDALIPTLFIPLFFLIVNLGQAGGIFPADDTPFLHGQSYAAFQLPVSLLIAASFGSAALYLVEEIEGGYLDKVRATPVARSSIVLGRLLAEFLKSLCVGALVVLLAFPFGARIASGIGGFVVLIVMIAGWAMVFSGFMQLVALKTRNAAATQSAGLVFFPLLFMTPNFVPRELLTRPMEIAATFNPVTYIMEGSRTLILQGFDWASVGRGFAVVAVAGAVMLALSIHSINSYD